MGTHTSQFQNLLQSYSNQHKAKHTNQLNRIQGSVIPAHFYINWFFFFSFFFFRQCHAAFGILVPRPGIKPVPPALGARSLNQWTTREVPQLIFNWIQFKGAKTINSVWKEWAYEHPQLIQYKHLHTNVHSNIICNSQKTETTLMFTK